MSQSKHQAPTTSTVTLHGVFMDVFNLGVFLTGASGIGKSEFALALISNGHRLVADDAVIFTHLPDHEQVIGSCPTMLKDFLEVRGLGILNIRAMFGDNALSDFIPLKLIIHLLDIGDEQILSGHRLYGIHSEEKILHMAIPKVILPVGPGRNVAVLIEAAVRNHRLKLAGYHASEDFIRKQKLVMQGRKKV